MGFLKKRKQTTSNKQKQDSYSKSDGIHFLKQPDKSTDEDKQLAKRLLTALRKRRYVQGLHTTKEWANQIRLLRSKDRHSEKTIVVVLDWYISHFDLSGIKLRLPTDLRRCFARIQEHMEKSGKYDNIQVGEQAQRLAKELKLKTWPKGSAKQLETVCQLSFDNLAAFRRKMKLVSAQFQQQAEAREKKTGLCGGLIERKWKWIEFVLRRLNSPDAFLGTWYEDYYDRIYDWDRWNGIIKVFNYTDKKFDQLMCDWESEYAESGELWPEIKDLVGQED